MEFNKWNKYRSSRINKDYYFNTITEETQWEIPIDETIIGSLDADWEVKGSKTDPSLTYYYNTITGISTYIFPGIIKEDKCKNVNCDDNKICNPKTGKCVLRTGNIGTKLLRGKMDIGNIYAVIDPLTNEINKFPVKFNNIGEKNAQYKLGLDKNFKYEPHNITGCTKRMEINKYLDKMLTYKDKIVNLSISNCIISNDAFNKLEQFNNLTTLNISKIKLGPEDVDSISNLTSLTTLDISDNKIGIRGVEYISKLTSLTTLDISKNYIRDLPIDISNLMSLTALNISNNTLRLSGANTISTLTSLITLNISGIYIGQQGSQYISQLPSLETLDISYNWIGSQGANYISQSTSLTSLNINRNRIGLEGAEYISQLKSLTTLNISGNNIRTRGAEYISQLTSLTTLDISYNDIGPRGAEFISQLTSLTKSDKKSLDYLNSREFRLFNGY